MQISREDEQSVALSQLDLLCCELLHQVPLSAETDDPSARRRLFSSPTAGAEPAFDQDWTAYVEPELRQIFQTALETVRDDLKDFPPADPTDDITLHIPVSHLEAWIHSLNQARLALAASNEFTDAEMERPIPVEGDTRALALFQVHFYGFLIECFLRELEREP